jgi:hypothetical protein
MASQLRRSVAATPGTCSWYPSACRSVTRPSSLSPTAAMVSMTRVFSRAVTFREHHGRAGDHAASTWYRVSRRACADQAQAQPKQQPGHLSRRRTEDMAHLPDLGPH